uniref:Uncharacterized protein n=1 Tax=Streptomyces avermitilis TaxID=33903 RepID=A0A499VGG6_STRAX|nr:hypothetical protein SAVMC3_61620 [Streptomyces avermitilis]
MERGEPRQRRLTDTVGLVGPIGLVGAMDPVGRMSPVGLTGFVRLALTRLGRGI